MLFFLKFYSSISLSAARFWCRLLDRVDFVSQAQSHALALGADSNVADDGRVGFAKRFLDTQIGQSVLSKHRTSVQIGCHEPTIAGQRLLRSQALHVCWPATTRTETDISFIYIFFQMFLRMKILWKWKGKNWKKKIFTGVGAASKDSNRWC